MPADLSISGRLIKENGAARRTRTYWLRAHRRLVCISILIFVVTFVPLVSLAGLLNYRPDTSVPFPFISPPQGPETACLVTTVEAIAKSFVTSYVTPFKAESFKGQGFMFQMVSISANCEGSSKTDGSLYVNIAQFVARNPSDITKLKAGDSLDVCTGVSKESLAMIVFTLTILQLDLFCAHRHNPVSLAWSPGISIGGY
jgi:hypothetical protein